MKAAKRKTVGKKPATSSKEKTSVTKVSRTLQPEGMALEEWQRLLRAQYGEKQPFSTTGHLRRSCGKLYVVHLQFEFTGHDS